MIFLICIQHHIMYSLLCIGVQRDMLVGLCCVRGCCLDSSILDVLFNIQLLEYLCEKMLLCVAAAILSDNRKISQEYKNIKLNYFISVCITTRQSAYYFNRTNRQPYQQTLMYKGLHTTTYSTYCQYIPLQYIVYNTVTLYLILYTHNNNIFYYLTYNS